MKIASIKMSEPEREDVRSFFGLNRQSSRGVGESSDEENVSSDLFPFLSPRRNAVRLTDGFGTCRAITVKDHPAWVTEIPGGTAAKLYFAGQDTGAVLTPGKKQLVSMGTRIIVFPDKVCYDTANSEITYLDASYETEEGVSASYTLSRLDGGEYEYDSSATPPSDPADGALWCDTSSAPASLMKYSASSG